MEYSSEMTDKQFRRFAKAKGFGKSEIETYGAIDPKTGRRVFEGFKSDAEQTKKEIQERKESGKARAATAPSPKVEEELNKPLSRHATAALSGYGVVGPKTYREAFAHLESTSALLGSPRTPTKRTKSFELSPEEEEIRSRMSSQRQAPKISGIDAAILDQAHHVHALVRSTAMPTLRGSSIRATRFTPSGEHDESIKEVTRPDFTPRSGRPLINLPAVPSPMTGGTPGQRKYQQGKYNKAIAERHAMVADLHTQHTARVTQAITAREAPAAAGLMWSYDPDDGGWAHRPNTPPVGQAPSSIPEPPTSNGPVTMRDVISTAVGIIAKEEDLAARKLAARSKYPEQDNPVF